MHERNTDHIIIIRIVHILDFILQPFDLSEILGRSKLGIVFLYPITEGRHSGQMGIVVNGFPKDIAAVVLVGSNLGHDEVALA